MSKFIISSQLFLGMLFSPVLLQAFQVEGVYIISKMEDEYSGEGVEWILGHHNATQFILFGEQHGVKGIPEFVDFIYSSLTDSGFYHLALETDRWTTDQAEKKGVKSFIRKYPHSIAFDSDGDLALMETAISAYGRSSGQVLWGMDQMITAIHPFQRLAEIAPNSYAKRLARGASLKATLKMGEYLREEHFRDLDAIEEAFGEELSAEASMILNDLRTSMDIYTKWRAGARGEISKRISPEIRENMMKNRLDDYLSENGPTSKVIFKMGGAHTMYGVGPNEVETLGEHAKQIAEENSRQSLSLGIRGYNPESGFPTDAFWGNSDMILINVNQYLQNKTLSDLPQFDDQFDALIYIKNSERATKSRVYHFEQKFKESLLTSLAIGGILGLVLLSPVIPAGLMVIRRKDISTKKPKYPFLIISTVGLAAVGLMGIQIFGFFNYPEMFTRITGSGLWIYIPFILVAGYMLYLAFSAWRKDWWEKGKRIYFYVLTLSFAAFCWYMWYWNIGGMLGN